MRIGGPPFRRAVAASVALHVLLALAIVLATREDRGSTGKPPRVIDTRVAVEMRFIPDSVDVPVEPPLPVKPPEPDPHVPAPVGPSPPPRHTRPPVVRTVHVPQALPPELLALMRRPAEPDERPTSTVEAPAAPATAPVEPAAETAAQRPAPLVGGRAIHGALASGQSIVYVVDASGSMGEWGKFDVARRALAATLRSQPETVRFQIVVYSGSAEFPVRVRGRTLMPATAANVERAAAALQSLGAPAGSSNHAAALRAALELQPDMILILTDAAEWPATGVRGTPRAGMRPVICMAKVAAEGVGPPAEVK